ncbi:Endonuclease/exonuclease/phosphatase [Mycena metata]|uniref:Endonuclease/exonuclease/phosphatase n=1 Tax=Mycena metata TaxID=1033252 RepID=A0AAD7HTN8_9AGAR|nr:Endonuclease/exonuclease/phosphatase [Mycena metata]
METLMGVYCFDVICLQEPWAKEAETFEHSGYYLITPNFPVSSICPRPDLANSPDILVVDLILKSKTISLINLYNDCETRAGVGLINSVLDHLPLKREVISLMDSNSHHVQWDSNTKTKIIDADFDLHDCLIAHPLTLITPPDIPTHLPSGNVIDLGWASPSLLPHIYDVTVETGMGLGSDHLPITYVLDLELDPVASSRYNPESMDINKFLAILQRNLGDPITQITMQRELDDAVDWLVEWPVDAVEGSMKR